MRILRAGPLRVRAIGEGDGPAIVLCHGYGAPGDDLVPLAGALDLAIPGAGRVRWFFPEAPGELDMGFGQSGRYWWPIDMARIQLALMSGRPREFPTDQIPDGIEDARAALDGCFDALVAEHGVDPARTLIGGFSQGAMLTADRAILGARTWAGVALLSGALIAEPQWRAALATRGARLDVFQSHGHGDPLLPFAIAEQLGALLVASGARREFHPFRGQHEIPRPVLAALGAFAKRVLAA